MSPFVLYWRLSLLPARLPRPPSAVMPLLLFAMLLLSLSRYATPVSADMRYGALPLFMSALLL